MVGKALRLLTTLGELPGGATLSELSRAADYPTSTTFRLLGALARDGFVELDEATKRYRLGLTIFALASASRRRTASAASRSRSCRTCRRRRGRPR